MPSPLRQTRGLLAACAAGMFILGSTGCSTPLAAGRAHFHAGRYDRAELALADESRVRGNDRALFLMERGTVRQAAGRYAESARDYIAAYDELERLRVYSVSKGAASLVINDNVQPFRGAPYERTLLHGLTALSHLALGAWDHAAVESRRILESLDPLQRGDFPEDAFSRYIAGLGFELQDDPSNAALQYRLAAAVAPAGTHIVPETGHVGGSAPANGDPAPARPAQELVCFVLTGRGPTGYESYLQGAPGLLGGHVEIRIGGRIVGRSHLLTDVAQLAADTERKLAALRAAKTAVRVVGKRILTHEIGRQAGSGDLGDLLFLLLVMMEDPEFRRWETLPRSIHVARVPCPADLESFEVVWRGPTRGAPRVMTVASPPMQRRRNLRVAFVRDLPLPRTDAPVPGKTPAAGPAAP
jgi:tetratricopeptide (TPR) repeat protein